MPEGLCSGQSKESARRKGVGKNILRTDSACLFDMIFF